MSGGEIMATLDELTRDTTQWLEDRMRTDALARCPRPLLVSERQAQQIVGVQSDGRIVTSQDADAGDVEYPILTQGWAYVQADDVTLPSSDEPGEIVPLTPVGTYSSAVIPNGVPPPSVEQMQAQVEQMQAVRIRVEAQLEQVMINPQDLVDIERALPPGAAEVSPDAVGLSLGGVTFVANSYVPAGSYFRAPAQGLPSRPAFLAENIALPESPQAKDDTEPPAVLALRGETPPTHGETKPFTDADFDKLIESIEELTDEKHA